MSTLFVAFEDFIMSREAALCSAETIDFYRRMLEPLLAFIDGRPPSNRVVGEFLATVAQRGVSSATVHAHARAMRAFVRFAYKAGWIEEPAPVRTSKLERKREGCQELATELLGDKVAIPMLKEQLEDQRMGYEETGFPENWPVVWAALGL